MKRPQKYFPLFWTTPYFSYPLYFIMLVIELDVSFALSETYSESNLQRSMDAKQSLIDQICICIMFL